MEKLCATLLLLFCFGCCGARDIAYGVKSLNIHSRTTWTLRGTTKVPNASEYVVFFEDGAGTVAVTCMDPTGSTDDGPEFSLNVDDCITAGDCKTFTIGE